MRSALFLALIGISAAQIFDFGDEMIDSHLVPATCNCAIWSNRDIPGNRGEGMVEFYGSIGNISDCSVVIERTECYETCIQFANEFRDDKGICQLDPDAPTQCFGDIWCSRIDPAYVEGQHQLQVMVRMPECKLHGENWNFVDYAENDDLCCDAQGRNVACENQFCDCRAVANFSCECGLFAPQMFDNQHRPSPNVDPLPFVFVGDGKNSEGPEFDDMCTYFPTLPEAPVYDECSAYCGGLVGAEPINATLHDPFPKNPSYTYGQVYCRALADRVKNFDGTGTEGWPLQVYGRLRDCAGKDRWAVPVDGLGDDVPFLEYRDPLCCTGEGEWVPDCVPAAA
jgi:hypothetical protein